MKYSNSVDFNNRWDQAIKSPGVMVADVEKVAVNVSMETILDRYLKSVEAEVGEHKISQAVCDQLAAQFTQVKSVLQAIDKARQAATSTPGKGEKC